MSSTTLDQMKTINLLATNLRHMQALATHLIACIDYVGKYAPQHIQQDCLSIMDYSREIIEHSIELQQKG